MPKKKLIWYPGAMYHVTSRGNRRSNIFKEYKDYILYLQYLNEAIKYYENKYEIISYCLMTNHVHLQIKTCDKHLWYLMSRVNKNYATNFNIKYNYIGHLFQTRYNAELIERGNYIHALKVSRYIHLNPVRANMVSTPQEYKWSSYSMYIGNKKEKLINSDYILAHFENKDRELYRKYVEGNSYLGKNIK